MIFLVFIYLDLATLYENDVINAAAIIEENSINTTANAMNPTLIQLSM